LFIPDPDPGSSGQKGTGSRIQGSKMHRIPNPDLQHCTLTFMIPVLLDVDIYFCCDSLDKSALEPECTGRKVDVIGPPHQGLAHSAVAVEVGEVETEEINDVHHRHTCQARSNCRLCTVLECPCANPLR
jgi:hypothetical protein